VIRVGRAADLDDVGGAEAALLDRTTNLGSVDVLKESDLDLGASRKSVP